MSTSPTPVTTLSRRGAGWDPATAPPEDRAAAMLAASPDLVWFTDAADRVVQVNATAAELLGWDLQHAQPTASSAFSMASRAVLEVDALPNVRMTGTWTGELTLRSRSGDRVQVSVAMVAGHDADGDVAWIGTVARDLRGSREFVDQLRHQVTHDALTGLRNRAGFDAAAALVVAHGRAAVLLCGIDHLRVINDTLGHAAGDAVLTEVADRLRRSVRDVDVLARFGGDQFVLALPGMSVLEAHAVADRILTDLQSPCTAGGQSLHVNVSIGVAVAGTSRDVGLDRLLQEADMALHLAKTGGRGCVEVYDEDAHQRILQQQRLRQDLNGALDRGEFHLVYQPIIGLADQRTSSVEALLRWDHPELGTISPVAFIPMLEENGRIAVVGRWVLHDALRQLAAWRATDPAAARMAVNVNVSTLQLHPSFAAEVAEALALTGVPPAQLVLELTESALANDPHDVVGLLEEIRATGVRIALDDFGTGYSSLGRLQALPIDHLKIDRSFVQALDATGDTAMIAGIYQMADALGMRVVAEGIEDAATAEVVRSLNCTAAQGYHWARPLPADRVLDFLTTNADGSSPA